MDPLIILVVYIISFVVGLLLLYVVVKAAVLEGLKEHTRWVTAKRDDIEAKYGVKQQSPRER